MDRQQILDRVLGFLAELVPDADASFSASTPLSDTTLIDSLAVVEVIMFLEEDFGLGLERADLDYIDTPENIVELVLAKRTGER